MYKSCAYFWSLSRSAGVAQLVEQRFCKPPVVGSSPITSSVLFCNDIDGEIPKRPTGADCKSVVFRLRRFESCSPHERNAGVTQLVECQPSKLNVASSSLVARSEENAAIAQG